MTQPPDLNSLSHADKDELIRTLFAQVAELTATVEELKGRLALDSSNSGKPPSSNGLKKPNKNTSTRGKSGKKIGGQRGHVGQTLNPVAEPDKIEIHCPPSHCGCGLPLEETQPVAARQVFDIPKIQPIVTEHRVHEARCRCGQVHRGHFPVGVTGPVQYGPTVKAMVVHLTHHEMQPVARTGQLMGTLFGLPLADATVLSIQQEAAERLTPQVDGIKEALKSVPALHADETGMKVSGKCQWVHVAATEDLTWMGAHPKRDKVAFDGLGLLGETQGVLIHGGLPAYRLFDQALHGLCNQHHLRELKFIAEQPQQPWAEDLMALLRRACHEVNESPTQTLSADRLDYYRLSYTLLLQAGEAVNPEIPRPKLQRRGKVKQSKAYNLLHRLKTYDDHVWRFAYDPHVPFTNNIAEQAIRMNKVKQKISGGFRTKSGLENFCTIRSYLATLKKQGVHIFDALVQTFQRQPVRPAFV